MSKSRADLTISAVAERTSFCIAVLRAWESRFGFPRSERLPGGHRRYTDRQVGQIVEVVRLRDAGMVLGSAIEDECLAQAVHTVLIGCFQRERFLSSKPSAVAGTGAHGGLGDGE